MQVGDDESTRREFRANRTVVGTSPAGSEWTKNPVPNCAGLGGGYMNPDPAVCPQGYQVTLVLLGIFNYHNCAVLNCSSSRPHCPMCSDRAPTSTATPRRCSSGR